MKTYKLTSEKIEHYGITLYRIEAIIDIPNRGIKCGDKGGFAERDALISGNAWISGDAWIYGDARISGDALISGNAQIYGNAQISGDAHVECASAVLLISIGGFYTFTMTRKYLFAGCKQIERKLWKKITLKQAVEMGCRKELYKPLKAMILEAAKIVKKEP